MSTKARVDTHNTSNERAYFSLSIDISIFEKKYGGRKIEYKKVFFLLLFLIVHISTNFILDGLKFWMDVPNIHVEGTVSQIFVSCLSFHFMSKNGYFFIYFFNILF